MYRNASSTKSGGSFDEQTIEAVWRKGTPEAGLTTFRKDVCGASMQRGKYGDRLSAYGWEIDHIKPVSLGGTDDLSNLQPLQWANNVFKSDDYPQWACKVRN